MRDEDPMSPARGCLFGVIIGTAVWSIAATIALIIWKAMGR